MPAKIFILSGPAGAGKTTLLNRLFRKKSIQKNFIKATSYTTRSCRPAEKEARDYFFVSKEKFLQLKKKEFFLESQKVLDNYYGTPRHYFNRALKEKKILVLCIDVKGGMYLKKQLQDVKIVTIFIKAVDERELTQRLKKRVETKDLIKQRLKLAKKELQFSRYYDYVVINQDLGASLKTLSTILLRETSAKST